MIPYGHCSVAMSITETKSTVCCSPYHCLKNILEKFAASFFIKVGTSFCEAGLVLNLFLISKLLRRRQGFELVPFYRKTIQGEGAPPHHQSVLVNKGSISCPTFAKLVQPGQETISSSHQNVRDTSMVGRLRKNFLKKA